ncbi:MAG TPA: uracil-DNA glycosylase [Chloroflexia bacterium]|nr:uracil-DNA glycosylase [Chloroflexia bacterium]
MSEAALEQIAKEIAVCTKCSLCKTRTHTVPGEGSASARLLFIGEAPGFHEDQQGRPFVGQSGQLLNKLLNAIKIPRQDVFIANVVKCRPPNNMDPTPEQIAACKPFLDRQIAAINPRLIVTLGRFSMARYWPGQRISQIHGQIKKENGRLHMPMFHPAAALRDPGRTLAMFKEDGLTIPSLLEKAEEIAREEIWGWTAETNEDSSTQPTLAATAPAPAPTVPEKNGHQVTKAETETITQETVAPLETATAEVINTNSEAEKAKAETAGPEVTKVEATGSKSQKTGRIRKSKAEKSEQEPVVETGSVEVEPTPPPARPRKKRAPVEAEQLRMF